ncbi:MAG: TetR family transcriptional regulator [Streptosporangiales bacterium]|nr:TetR family transcriptional regulator [Streptosporangiales bacterium]
MPRRRADAERNIAAILDASRELFGKGVNPSMNEIARAAGVGRVTLYGHFPSREVLLKAVVERAIAETNEALDVLGLDAEAADEALAQIIKTSWPILDRYRRLRLVALAELGPERLRRHHDRVLQRMERLIARGRDDRVFRTDLPRDWLVATLYAVLHAAADEVDTGRLPAAKASDVLTATVLSLLRPPAAAAPYTVKA